MQLRKLFLTMLVLVGVYSQSHSMDKDAWQTNLHEAIVHGNVGQLKTCIAQDATFTPEGVIKLLKILWKF